MSLILYTPALQICAWTRPDAFIFASWYFVHILSTSPFGGLHFYFFREPLKISDAFCGLLYLVVPPNLEFSMISLSRLTFSHICTSSSAAISTKRSSYECFYLSCAFANLSAARHTQCPLVNVSWTSTTPTNSFRWRLHFSAMTTSERHLDHVLRIDSLSFRFSEEPEMNEPSSPLVYRIVANAATTLIIKSYWQSPYQPIP